MYAIQQQPSSPGALLRACIWMQLNFVYFDYSPPAHFLSPARSQTVSTFADCLNRIKVCAGRNADIRYGLLLKVDVG